MQENERKQEHSGHHRERAHVVRICARYEPLVLRVLQRPHGNLRRAVQMRVAHSVVVHLELVHSVHVRDLETGLVCAVRFAFQGRAHERVDADEFELDVVRVERFPVGFVEDFDFDRVYLGEMCDNNDNDKQLLTL